MRVKKSVLLLLTVCMTGLSGCSIERKETVNICAAASLTEALEEIQGEYSKHSDDMILFNFAGSGTLCKQILEGAPCDLFISASKPDMDTLEEAGIIAPESRRNLLGNNLVLIGRTELSEVPAGIEEIADILCSTEINSISIGVPDTVPAGRYAEEALESLGLWKQLHSKLILAKDVRQIVEYIETGNVDAGLVYKTDALLLKNGKVLGYMPEESHSVIVYPAALIKESAQTDAAKSFYDFLMTDYAKDVFEKYGFTVL